MDGRVEVLQGDCRDLLPTLEEKSVQCCVTSPPYWGLRDYGTATWEGGESGCAHVETTYPGTRAGLSKLSQRLDGRPRGEWDSAKAVNHQYKSVCGHCGAHRIDSQLGLESSPQIYVSNMVRVFREVWRVLRDDGTLWLNMGDSYAHGIPGGECVFANGRTDGREFYEGDKARGREKRSTLAPGLKPKDLVGIPWRLAFALQEDGWYLRSDIIWHKPNPMPESVTDRPTTSHEHIFLLAKQERYFYDADAIREDASGSIPWGRRDNVGQYKNNQYVATSGTLGVPGENGRRNKRSVWTVATQPYSEAHFATFPEDLIKPCILAGSRVGDTVLDPFGGSGTTGKVALELGRKAVLIELNPKYIDLVHKRVDVTPGFF